MTVHLSGDILIGLSMYVILSIYLSLSYVHPFLPHPDPFGYLLCSTMTTDYYCSMQFHGLPYLHCLLHLLFCVTIVTVVSQLCI
jgi:hypothetical protein